MPIEPGTAQGPQRQYDRQPELGRRPLLRRGRDDRNGSADCRQTLSARMNNGAEAGIGVRPALVLLAAAALYACGEDRDSQLALKESELRTAAGVCFQPGIPLSDLDKCTKSQLPGIEGGYQSTWEYTHCLPDVGRESACAYARFVVLWPTEPAQPGGVISYWETRAQSYSTGRLRWIRPRPHGA